MADRNVDKNQWADPCLLMVGNGNEEWARWATKWLYEDIAPEHADSTDWPKYGIITQFDRRLVFNGALNAGLLAGEIQSQLIPTNNRNWLLVSRAAVARNAQGVIVGLDNFNVNITVPTTTLLMEDQPASNTFGTGQWPHVLYFPEEWTQNVPRTVTAQNNSVVAATLTLSFKFLQVRTN